MKSSCDLSKSPQNNRHKDHSPDHLTINKATEISIYSQSAKNAAKKNIFESMLGKEEEIVPESRTKITVNQIIPQ